MRRNNNKNYKSKYNNKRGYKRNNYSRNPRAAAESGNQRERISIESGALVLLDQFMLANPQFIAEVEAKIDESMETKNQIINDFGGVVLEVEAGTCKINRDPYAYTIVIHKDQDEIPATEDLMQVASENIGDVKVDTRCLAMFDRELLNDIDFLNKYSTFWFESKEKSCRDLLRDNGGSARYGFNRSGDELAVFKVPNEDIVCIWPVGTDPVESKKANSAKLEEVSDKKEATKPKETKEAKSKETKEAKSKETKETKPKETKETNSKEAKETNSKEAKPKETKSKETKVKESEDSKVENSNESKDTSSEE